MGEHKRPIRGLASAAGMFCFLGAWLVFLDSFVGIPDGHLHVPPLAKPILAIAGFLVAHVAWRAWPGRRHRL